MLDARASALAKHSSHRFVPGASSRLLVNRARIVGRLRDRFENRLTLLTGPAGAGKSTSLMLAMENNRLDPWGDDVFLGALEADRDPASLLSGLLAALKAPQPDELEVAFSAVVEAVLGRAPGHVALIVDDVHNAISEETTEVLGSLLYALPSNGHLVLAGRSIPDVSIARLRAHGEVLEIGEHELDFDDEELLRLAELRGDVPDPGSEPPPRHPATADLRLTAGLGASQDFIWEEVLSLLPPQRLRHLALVSVLDRVDDQIVDVVTGEPIKAVDLVEGLPLVDRSDDGVCRLHSLLRGALAPHLGEEERDRVCRVAAQALVERDELPAAIALLDVAGLSAELLEAGRAYAELPLLRCHNHDVRAIARTVRRHQPNSALALLLEIKAAATPYDTPHQARFDTLLRLAREGDDRRVEALGLTYALEAKLARREPVPDVFAERIRQLAAVDSRAMLAARWIDILELQNAHRIEEALELLQLRLDIDPAVMVSFVAARMTDLGHPELVGAMLEPDDLAKLPPGDEIYVAYGMWLRGELPPELAWEFVADMVPRTFARRQLSTDMSLSVVAAQIAGGAGLLDELASFVQRAVEIAQVLPVQPAAFAQAAAANAALILEGEDAARAAIDAAIDLAAVGEWPVSRYHIVLPMLYLLRPDARPVLDRCREHLGASLSLAIEAGVALVAARESGEFKAAADLRWSDENVLRTHVPPPLLVELCCAAVAGGRTDLQPVLDRLPQMRTYLERVITDRTGDLQEVARILLSGLPASANTSVEIRALGELTVLRDGVPVDDENWVKRAKVKQLLALLVERRHISRELAADLLWPDLDGARAGNNLRVTLSHLNRVLEPARNRSDEAIHIESSGDLLRLNSAVRIDVDDFEQEMSRATKLDTSGAPSEALVLYRKVLERYRGSYVDGIDSPWLEDSRIRLQSLAADAASRLCELVFARGEPNEAAALANRALQISPLNERAGRGFITAIAATGSKGEAAAAGRALLRRLSDAELDPEPETLRLLSRFGV
ncbi:MAG: AAA family ATPase [Actinomycetia bacterium]|nr:AAA family ATPase [Actinomycetes bacterium]MCP4958061.1 AAA family ATPase [Actinomycetes bacterium]